jgi:2-polyprenyl-3-methyl-5-hydroxy-6-metoxy-1,4-benzoquinol methylase
MKWLDRFLQRYRIRMVRPHLSDAQRVLDIGCDDGVLLDMLNGIKDYVGIDPVAPNKYSLKRGVLIKGHFPADLPDQRPFDAITMLAVLEHIPAQDQAEFAATCAKLLNPGGKILITVPSPVVDSILVVLRALRLLDAESLEEHYGFDVRKTPEIFGRAGLQLIAHRRFQLGLNNLFVFANPSD